MIRGGGSRELWGDLRKKGNSGQGIGKLGMKNRKYGVRKLEIGK